MSIGADNLAAMRTIATRVIREATGMHEPEACAIAIAILERIQQSMGGGYTYLPAPPRPDRAPEILSAVRSGMRTSDVSRRLRVSVRTVQRVVAASRGT